MLLRPDDPAMLLVTMNEVVLEQVIEGIEARAEEMVAGIERRSAQHNASRWEVSKGKLGKPELQCVRRFRRILTLGDCTREN